MDNNEQITKKTKKGKIGIIIAVVIVVLAVILLIAGFFMGVIGGIDEQEARQAALDQVPGSQDENIVSLVKEFDDGRMEYNVKLVYNNTAYDFKILAKDGSIYNQEQESIGGTQTTVPDSSSEKVNDIGIEKAKEIAIAQVSGSTVGDIVKAEADTDDGALNYDIEIIYNEIQYDFEISAETGDVLKMESESIYD